MFGETLQNIEFLLGELDLCSPPENLTVHGIYPEVADSDYGSYPDSLLVRRSAALSLLYGGLRTAAQRSTLSAGSVERQVDDRGQILFIEGLDDVAGRIHSCSAFYCLMIGICREKNNRNLSFLPDPLRRLDTVEITIEPNIHQYNIRLQPASRFHRVFAGRCQSDVISHRSKEHFEIEGDDLLIFNYQYLSVIHCEPGTFSVRKLSNADMHTPFFQKGTGF